MGAGVVGSADDFAGVSAAAGAGDGESDLESPEARTAQVTDRARNARITAVSEGRSSFFSIIR